MSNGNKRKDAALGEPHGTAANRLRRSIIFHLAGACDRLSCYRCGSRIESVETFSIEHKTAWLSAADPKHAFFDLNNIAFSHLRCNVGCATQENHHNKVKAACPRGHRYDTHVRPSGGRRCRECKQEEDRKRDRTRVGS